MDNKDNYCSLGLAKIVSANSFTRIYEVIPLFKHPSVSGVLRAISLNSRGNTEDGVQVSPSYQTGDIVLIVYQEDAFVKDRLHVAYILGTAPYEIFVGEKLEDWVRSGRMGYANIGPLNFKGFDLLEATVNPGRVIQTHTGHGTADLLPGDWEVAGKMVGLHVGDYLAGISALGAELLVDPIARRVIEQSMLRSVYTVNSVEDISIVNDKVITTKKVAGNVRDAFYNCLEETKEGIFPRGVLRAGDPGKLDPKKLGSDKKPFYRDITQSGDLLGGTLRQIISADGKTPLYQNYIGFDGGCAIKSARRVVIGKQPNLKGSVYTGERIVSDAKQKGLEYSQTTALPFNPGYFSEYDNIPGWDVVGNTDLDKWVEQYGYPDEFVSPDEPHYPAGESLDIKDPVYTESKGFPLYPKISYIELGERGDIFMEDGYGSYIQLSHGNIEIYAANNLFLISGRDTLSFAGANQTLYAGENVEMQAYRGKLSQAAGKDIKMMAGDYKKPGSVVIEGDKEVSILSKAFSVDALNQVFRCRDIDTDGALTGNGTFCVLAPNGSQIGLVSDDICINATNAFRVNGGNRALAIAGDAITIAGDIKLLGGLCTDLGSLKYKVFTETGELSETKTFQAGTYADINNPIGGIRANTQILSEGQILAGGPIVGSDVMAMHPPADGKLHKPRNSQTLKSYIRKYTPLRTTKTFKLTNPANSITNYRLTNKYFAFTNYSLACTTVYNIETPEKSANTMNYTGITVHTTGNNANQSYIYPGKAFWTATGLAGRNPFSSLKCAKPNNREVTAGN